MIHRVLRVGWLGSALLAAACVNAPSRPGAACEVDDDCGASATCYRGYCLDTSDAPASAEDVQTAPVDGAAMDAAASPSTSAQPDPVESVAEADSGTAAGSTALASDAGVESAGHSADTDSGPQAPPPAEVPTPTTPASSTGDQNGQPGDKPDKPAKGSGRDKGED